MSDMRLRHNLDAFDKAAQKRIKAAIHWAEKACTEASLQDVYARRFHRAMDALQSEAEGEAVYDVCRLQGWYEQAVAALARGSS